MAAADYYNQIPGGHQPQPNPSPGSRPQYLSPQSVSYHPSLSTSNLTPPQPPPPPPPYHEMPAEKPHLPADQQYQRNSFSHSQRPPPQSWNSPYTPPIPSPFSKDHQPFYPPQIHPQYPAQQPVYQNPPPHLRPYHQNHSSPNLNQGYSSDPEPHRRRRTRHKSSSRSANADGFLGAAGGGLIGDLIFPGLGTLGGAVAGYLGGKDYGKHRKRKESMTREEQRQWEMLHGKRSHGGDRRYS